MTAPRHGFPPNSSKRSIIASSLVVLLLSGCAGGFPPTSSNGLNEYDVLFGLKEIPKGADNSRVWSPIHLVFDGKPTWSVVWFKQMTKNGVDYEFYAKPPEEIKNAKADDILEKSSSKIDALSETASLYIGEIKNWLSQLAD